MHFYFKFKFRINALSFYFILRLCLTMLSWLDFDSGAQLLLVPQALQFREFVFIGYSNIFNIINWEQSSQNLFISCVIAFCEFSKSASLPLGVCTYSFTLNQTLPMLKKLQPCSHAPDCREAASFCWTKKSATWFCLNTKSDCAYHGPCVIILLNAILPCF